MNISKRISSYRKKTGLSQEAFGKIIGVAPSAIASYEKGRRNPTGRVALKLHDLDPKQFDLRAMLCPDCKK